MSPFTHTLLYCALLLLTLKELTEACSCIISHPQEKFCNSDVVVRAKVISEKRISSPGHMDDTKQYQIKVMKVFKGDTMTIYHLQYVSTPSESAACGTTLQNQKEYLLGGNMYNGTVRIYLCGLHYPWESLSTFQIKSLSQPDEGYQQGCQCKIKFCGMETCDSKAPNECVWSDRQETETLEKEHACLKQKDGSCSWYPSIPGKSTHNSHP
ncbi:metalloproteinase inhibitor 2-like [Bufo gargarizans]|uniref:metalloproteinase inhibitor 2-like n=1 Tax=Bufo gargarizans TaxID=30331 RepID=UPI001CF376FD|nr:metalloproteinase inhibitor 2-like [Bufo gargarizans]